MFIHASHEVTKAIQHNYPWAILEYHSYMYVPRGTAFPNEVAKKQR